MPRLLMIAATVWVALFTTTAAHARPTYGAALPLDEVEAVFARTSFRLDVGESVAIDRITFELSEEQQREVTRLRAKQRRAELVINIGYIVAGVGGTFLSVGLSFLAVGVLGALVGGGEAALSTGLILSVIGLVLGLGGGICALVGWLGKRKYQKKINYLINNAQLRPPAAPRRSPLQRAPVVVSLPVVAVAF